MNDIFWADDPVIQIIREKQISSPSKSILLEGNFNTQLKKKQKQTKSSSGAQYKINRSSCFQWQIWINP